MTSQAMYAMLKRKDIVRDEGRDAQRNTQTQKTLLTKEEKDGIITGNAAYQTADAEFTACWVAWRRFYNNQSEAPNMRKQQAVVKSGLRPEFDAADGKVKNPRHVWWMINLISRPLYNTG